MKIPYPKVKGLCQWKSRDIRKEVINRVSEIAGNLPQIRGNIHTFLAFEATSLIIGQALTSKVEIRFDQDASGIFIARIHYTFIVIFQKERNVLEKLSFFSCSEYLQFIMVFHVINMLNFGYSQMPKT